MKLVQIIKSTFFIAIFCFIYFNISAKYAQASTSDNVFGKAWSENIGWISFNNCDNPSDASTCGSVSYGVSKTGNVVSGYAWNNNVGWISFNPTDWGTCPPSATGCTLSSFSNTWGAGGWGRAISARDSNASGTGKWDGWISLGATTGTTYSAPFGTTNAVDSSWGSSWSTYTVYVASGYWWGSDVVGWIDMSGDSGSSYNPANGGVFIMDLPSSLTLTPSSTSILSGDTVNFTWSVSDFTPVSCTGTGAGTDTDWTNVKSVSSQSGSYTSIHVPINTTTAFTLTCTDGSHNASGTASVTAYALTAGVSYNYSCVATGGSSPTLNWNTNDPSPSCQINAETTDHMTSYNFGVSGTSPGTETDINYQYKNTYYTLSCENGSGSYKATATSGQASVNMCVPNYTISGSTSCGGSAGATVVNNGMGTYEGTVTLTLNPLYGFVSNANINGSPYSGSLTFTPSSSFNYSGSSYNTIDAKLSLTTPEYNALLLTMSGSGVLETISTTVTGMAQNTTPKNVNLKFCAGTSNSLLKPIYKPF